MCAYFFDVLPPDCSKYISSPMDLGTISDRVMEHHYTNKAAFISDVELVFSNCVVYNSDESLIGQYARSLQSSFRVMWNKTYTRAFSNKPAVNMAQLKREKEAVEEEKEEEVSDTDDIGNCGNGAADDEEEEEDMTAPGTVDNGSGSDEDASEMDEDDADEDGSDSDGSSDDSEY
jgi:hypothetical protein